MAYDPDTPANSAEDPSQSQPKITANFQELNTFCSVNHVSLNDGDQGKHKFLQMPEQSSAPTTAANEGGLYTKEVSGVTQLFFRDESDGSERQMTGAFTTGVSDGQFVIPGGLTVKWGRRDGIGDNSTITFSTPFSSSFYNVQLTLIRNDTGNRFIYAKDGSFSVTGFGVRTNSGSTGVFFVAIGV